MWLDAAYSERPADSQNPEVAARTDRRLVLLSLTEPSYPDLKGVSVARGVAPDDDTAQLPLTRRGMEEKRTI